VPIKWRPKLEIDIGEIDQNIDKRRQRFLAGLHQRQGNSVLQLRTGLSKNTVNPRMSNI